MCCIGCEVTSYSSETFMTQIIPHWSGPRADLHSTATQGGGGGHRYAHMGGGTDLHRYGHRRGRRPRKGRGTGTPTWGRGWPAQVRPHKGEGLT